MYYSRREGFFMIKCCNRCGATKTIGLSVLAFTLGVVMGMLCPVQLLAVLELILLILLGYLCLFKW